jgi:hypothetical protein
MALKTMNERNPQDSLIIFNRFVLDRDLPKFQVPVDEEPPQNIKSTRSRISMGSSDGINIAPTGSEVFWSTDGNFTVQNTQTLTSAVTVNGVVMPSSKQSRWLRFRVWMYRVWMKFTQKKPEAPKPIPLVFKQILESDEQIKLFNERDEEFEAMVVRAKQASQKALVEKLELERNLRRFENMLYALGRKRFVSEKQLLKFVRGCEKGLCLDWVHQFTRPVPEEVVAEKVRCDAAHLFDNYVVLHYDPMNNSAEMTEQEKVAEIERKRDPILFGVIRGSRRLYFIGDWKDEQCDLTLQEIIDQLGEPLHMDGELESKVVGHDDSPPESEGSK